MDRDPSNNVSIKPSVLITKAPIPKPQQKGSHARSSASKHQHTQEHSSADVRLKQVQENLDMVLVKLSEPIPALPKYVTEIQLQYALLDLLNKAITMDNARVITLSKLTKDRLKTFEKLIKAFTELNKNTTKFFESVFSLLGQRRGEEIARYQVLLDNRQKQLKVFVELDTMKKVVFADEAGPSSTKGGDESPLKDTEEAFNISFGSEETKKSEGEERVGNEPKNSSDSRCPKNDKGKDLVKVVGSSGRGLDFSSSDAEEVEELTNEQRAKIAKKNHLLALRLQEEEDRATAY
ncbi:hypothetical protein L2E82_18463 [Cichorium intybus]|uniref:Uncharacterized protein n=1 Tax=Cichorium intybus TaxID=13427 RepID=A0ACB9FA68_CICIN|nr:hypothetical protein L2E82_18463 [Cichorium intybus]